MSAEGRIKLLEDKFANMERGNMLFRQALLNGSLIAQIDSTARTDTSAADGEVQFYRVNGRTYAQVFNRPASVWDFITDLDTAVVAFLEAHKGYFHLGGGVPSHTYGDNELVGSGFVTVEAGTGALSSDPGSMGWRLDTGATTGGHCGFNGPIADDAEDWTLKTRFFLNSAADQVFFIGAKTSADSFADENGLIGFRASGTGNLFFVTDSGGTETATDLSATFAGAWHSAEIRVRSGGTSITAYVNETLRATHTANIPTGNLHIAVGITNSANASKTAFIGDLIGWEEA